MQMSFERPPVWDNVLENFNINIETTLFTFGDVIYNPAEVKIPEDYIHHEEVHAEQQGHTPEGAGKWWARYFQDPYFRIDQEAKAYAYQYDWWCNNAAKTIRNNREYRAKKLLFLAKTLAGKTYGNVVNLEGATKLIKSFSKIK